MSGFLVAFGLMFGWMPLVAAGAQFSMARIRRQTARDRLEAAAWAITEEWTPCRRCGAPARPGETSCSLHGGSREEVHC